MNGDAMKRNPAKRNSVFACLLLFLIAWTGPAFALLPGEALPDPALEARARALSAELRCMVCQNQSIDLSDAELAHDLRLIVRERLKAGDTDEQVLDYVVSRYGEFVLLKPRLNVRNALLWGTPVLILLAGGLFVVLMAMRRRKNRPDTLTSAESAALDEILRR